MRLTKMLTRDLDLPSVLSCLTSAPQEQHPFFSFLNPLLGDLLFRNPNTNFFFPATFFLNRKTDMKTHNLFCVWIEDYV